MSKKTLTPMKIDKKIEKFNKSHQSSFVKKSKIIKSDKKKFNKTNYAHSTKLFFFISGLLLILITSVLIVYNMSLYFNYSEHYHRVRPSDTHFIKQWTFYFIAYLTISLILLYQFLIRINNNNPLRIIFITGSLSAISLILFFTIPLSYDSILSTFTYVHELFRHTQDQYYFPFEPNFQEQTKTPFLLKYLNAFTGVFKNYIFGNLFILFFLPNLYLIFLCIFKNTTNKLINELDN